MTQEEVIELARQAGMGYDEKPDVYIANIDDLQDFAKLVAEKEREACAKLFDDRDNGIGFYEPHEPAEIIRARGNV